MVYIYILQLEQGKYFVGGTHNPEFNLHKHFDPTGSQWTLTYPPISLLYLITDCDEYDEDKYVRKYMDQYGIDNVRGGSFCEEVLPESSIAILGKMKNTCDNICSNCKQMGHYSEYCTTKMNDIEYPDNMDDLLQMIGDFIQDKKCSENMDMSEDNVINTILRKKNLSEADILYWKTTIHKKNKEKGIDFIKPTDVQAVEQIELKRTEEQRVKNKEYLPIMEAMYKSIGKLNDKVNIMEESIMSFV